MILDNYFELVFCRKSFKTVRLLDCFNVLGLNDYKFSFGGFMLLQCFILTKLVLKFFFLLKDLSIMTFCYILECFMLLRDFNFMKLV